MLETAPTRCRQGLLERRRLFLVGLGQSPHLVRGQAQVSEHSPKGLAAVDDLQELPAFLDLQPRLRSASSACPGFGAWNRRHLVQLYPAFHLVMVPWAARLPRRRPSGSVRLRTFLELLRCPRRTRNEAQGKPPPDDRRRHTGGGGRLTD